MYHSYIKSKVLDGAGFVLLLFRKSGGLGVGFPFLEEAVDLIIFPKLYIHNTKTTDQSAYITVNIQEY